MLADIVERTHPAVGLTYGNHGLGADFRGKVIAGIRVEACGDLRRNVGEHRRVHVPMLGVLVAERLENGVALRFAQLEKLIQQSIRLPGLDVILE
jgi:hypothetical protein